MIQLRFVPVLLTLLMSLTSGFTNATPPESQSEFEEKIRKNSNNLPDRLFSSHFEGFDQTDFKMFENNRALNLTENSNPISLKELEECYKSLSGPNMLNTRYEDKLTPFRDELANIISDRKNDPHRNYTRGEYTLLLMRIALTISDPTEDEYEYFEALGVDYPHRLSKNWELPSNANAIQTWQYLQKIDDEGSYKPSPEIRCFYDNSNTISNLIRNSAISGAAFPLPGQGRLGYFYLAYTYYQGLHPVPLPFTPNGRTHGISMSPWGNLCHDLAHHDLDQSTNSVEGYAVLLLNAYYKRMSEEHSKLSLQFQDVKKKTGYVKLLLAGHKNYLRQKIKEFNQQTSIHKMIPDFTRFAIAIHAAYRDSLVDILRKAYEVMLENNSDKEAFQAFSVAAFNHSHEEPEYMGRKYGLQPLSEILTSSIPRDNRSEDDKICSLPTHYSDGSCPLTDEEIIEKVMKLPLSSFEHNIYTTFSAALNEEEVVTSEVTRNKFGIKVEFKLREGNVLTYRQPTNHALYLNFKHDLYQLKEAQSILESKFGYTPPKEVPSLKKLKQQQMTEKEFEAACKAYYDKLLQGKQNLRDFFLEKAIELSELSAQSSPSIADTFKTKSQNAFKALYDAVPRSLFRKEEDLKELLSKATSPQPEAS